VAGVVYGLKGLCRSRDNCVIVIESCADVRQMQKIWHFEGKCLVIPSPWRQMITSITAPAI